MTTLSTLLRQHTAEAHRQAERQPFVADWIAARLDRHGHALALRQLHALYAALEPALAASRSEPALAPTLAVLEPGLWRPEALAQDLHDWHAGPEALPLAPALAAFAAQIGRLQQDEPVRLLAHAYVRYLGDLSGGRLLRRAAERVREAAGAGGRPLGLRFYDIHGDAAVLAARLRAALDAVPPADHEAVVDEALQAFAWHARLFEELQALRVRQGDGSPASRMRP